MGRTRAPIAVLHVPTHLSAGQTRLMLALRACVDGRVETGNLDRFGLWQCRCSRGESGAPALQTARPLMGRKRRLTAPSRGRSRAMHAPAAGQASGSRSRLQCLLIAGEGLLSQAAPVIANHDLSKSSLPDIYRPVRC